jgi:hypothetical protein
MFMRRIHAKRCTYNVGTIFIFSTVHFVRVKYCKHICRGDWIQLQVLEVSRKPRIDLPAARKAAIQLLTSFLQSINFIL